MIEGVHPLGTCEFTVSGTWGSPLSKVLCHCLLPLLADILGLVERAGLFQPIWLFIAPGYLTYPTWPTQATYPSSRFRPTIHRQRSDRERVDSFPVKFKTQGGNMCVII